MATLGFFFVLLFLIFFTYSGVLYIPFGMSDDYFHLARILQAGGEQVTWAAGAKEGRIVQGFLLTHLFKPGNISDLSHYRIAALVGFSLFAFLIFLILKRHEKTTAAAAFAVMVVTLIPFQLWLAWSMLFLVSYAACLAVVAAILVNRAIPAPWGKKILFLALALAILWVSLNIYQPAAMMFWAAAAMLIFLENPGLGEILRRGIYYCAAGVIGLGVAFGSMKIAQELSGTNPARTSLVDDILGKLAWFLREPLMNALNFQNLAATKLIGVSLGLLILAGLWLFFKGNSLQKALSIVIAGGFALLAYLPNLIIQENWPSYRTLAALSMVLFFYLYLAVKQFYAIIGSRIPWIQQQFDHIFNLGMVAGAAVLILLTNQYFIQRLALPLYIEHRFLKESLASSNLAEASQIELIPPGWTDSVWPVVRYDEFGIPSSFPKWGTEPLARILLLEINPAYRDLPIHVIASKEEFSSLKGAVLIDLGNLRSYQYP